VISIVFFNTVTYKLLLVGWEGLHWLYFYHLLVRTFNSSVDYETCGTFLLHSRNDCESNLLNEQATNG
jgi:hypothetical protein